jgi:hypothetical protein
MGATARPRSDTEEKTMRRVLWMHFVKALVLVAAATGAARADSLISWKFEAIVTRAPSESPVQPGDTVFGYVRFDPGASNVALDPNVGLYLSAPGNEISVTLGDTKLLNDHVDIYVFNDYPHFPGSPFDSIDFIGVDLRLSLIDSTAMVIDSVALPLVPPDLDSLSFAIFSMRPQQLVPEFSADIISLTIDDGDATAAVADELQNLGDLITSLAEAELEGEAKFRNTNMGKAMQQKIDAALADLQVIQTETDPATRAELIGELRDKVANDIRAKADGCPPGPDANDWILDCADQALVQDLCDVILALLDSLA